MNQSEVTVAEPVLDEGRVVVLGGTPYQVKRLNVRHIFKVSKIIGIAVTRGGVPITEDMTDDPERLATLMIAAIPFAEEECVGLLGDLVGLTSEQFGELPPEALVDVIEVIVRSEDLKTFFDRCVAVFKQGGTLLNRNKDQAD